MGWKGVGVGLSLFLVMGTGAVFAQPESEEATDGGADVAVRQQARLTKEEQVKQGIVVRDRAAILVKQLLSRVDEATQAKDVILRTCLEEKLTRANANLRAIESRLGVLRDAQTGNDADLVSHQFRVLNVFDGRTKALAQEAAVCAGQDLFNTGSTLVTTSVESTLPFVDPANIPETPAFGAPFIPQPASPSR